MSLEGEQAGVYKRLFTGVQSDTDPVIVILREPQATEESLYFQNFVIATSWSLQSLIAYRVFWMPGTGDWKLD